MVIDLFVQRQIAPPTTAAQFHSTIARQHPHLFTAHADLYPVEPAPSPHSPPAVMFRGTRCLTCEAISDWPADLVNGRCSTCCNDPGR